MQDEPTSAQERNSERQSPPKESMILDGWLLPFSRWWSKMTHLVASGTWEAKEDGAKSPLADIVAKGKRLYYEGRSFRRWSMIMIQKYGQGASPLLADAWKLIEREASLARQRKQPMMDESSCDENESPKPKRLYRMVVPGRFAPVERESVAARTAKEFAARFAKGIWIRKTIVALAALLFILAGLFPPWLYTFDVAVPRVRAHAGKDAGYCFILSPPRPEKDERFYGIQLDTSRLLVEWACIAVAAGAAWFFCGAPGQKPDEKQPR